jgi:hypothetical protein
MSAPVRKRVRTARRKPVLIWNSGTQEKDNRAEMDRVRSRVPEFQIQSFRRFGLLQNFAIGRFEMKTCLDVGLRNSGKDNRPEIGSSPARSSIPEFHIQ